MGRYYCLFATWSAAPLTTQQELSGSILPQLGAPARCDRDGKQNDLGLWCVWDDPRLDDTVYPKPFHPQSDLPLSAVATAISERNISLALTDVRNAVTANGGKVLGGLTGSTSVISTAIQVA